jgi:hypothetical protein
MKAWIRKRLFMYRSINKARRTALDLGIPPDYQQINTFIRNQLERDMRGYEP